MLVFLDHYARLAGHNLQFSRFFGFRRQAEDIGVPCPNCSEGEVVERRSKRGKTFYGCSRYPDCDFVAWGKPIAEKCPECGSSYLIEKWLKAGAVAQCPNGECKYKRPLEPVPASA